MSNNRYSEPDKRVLEQFGAKIRRLRQQKGYSQEAFADLAKIERSYMGAIERGERNPTFLKVMRIVKALKTRSSDVLPF